MGARGTRCSLVRAPPGPVWQLNHESPAGAGAKVGLFFVSLTLLLLIYIISKASRNYKNHIPVMAA